MRESGMRIRLVMGMVLCGSTLSAQAVDPKVMQEVAAVRAALDLNYTGLRGYTWTEHTEVRVKGKVKSSSDALCRYDGSGKITRTPIDPAEAKGPSSTVSKRYSVRKKADMEDYIDRAIGRIQSYAPPDPEQIDRVVKEGHASLGRADGGKSEARFANYYEDGDSLVFRYDPVSKALVSARVTSTLGSPKDPVTMEVVFETLPDGVNHLGSATLIAKSKNVEVVRRNSRYEKTTR
jgi:hypothetical protein